MLADRTGNYFVWLLATFSGLDDVRLWYFASPVVWYLDHSAIRDIWMGQKMSFELCWCDLVALFSFLGQ